ncbi:hypothetical protein ACWD04_29870 [Streptomyces sp. NPDC002911]
MEGGWRIWQTPPTRFTDIEPLLPDLIIDVDTAARTHRTTPAVHRNIQRLTADLYGLLRSYRRRPGRTEPSLMVADRALRAAEAADAPLRIAVAK